MCHNSVFSNQWQACKESRFAAVQKDAVQMLLVRKLGN